MSNTHDYNIADQVGASFRADLNNVLGDIQSTNSGTSVPSSNVVGKLFVNTSDSCILFTPVVSGILLIKFIIKLHTKIPDL